MNKSNFPQLTDPLQRLVSQLENDPSLLEPNQLRRRLAALDRMDAFFFDSAQTAFGAESIEAELFRRTRAICIQLEEANHEAYESVRRVIRCGGRPQALLHWVDPPSESGNAVAPANDLGYDDLDELISGIFRFEEPVEQARREPETVPYQPTPARHIFRLIGLTALTASDVLVDLGSGLGQVPLLVSICTQARSVGIELEANYVQRAQQCAQSLDLKHVTFLHQDAREADLSTGTVFYLYTPFIGSILRKVLDRLRREALTRRIRICSYGPCTPVIANEPWLEADDGPEPHRITLFTSREMSTSPREE
jgi:histone methylation protein DOT1